MNPEDIHGDGAAGNRNSDRANVAGGRGGKGRGWRRGQGLQGPIVGGLSCALTDQGGLEQRSDMSSL